LLLSAAAIAEEPGPYRTIKIKEVFSKLMTRDKEDRVYSGQIKSEDGLAEFEKTYGIDIGEHNIDFKKQMLIFGITDSISTRAFQLLQDKTTGTIVLDYMDTGEQYRMRPLGESKKYSHLQVFILDRINGIAHVRVKNLE
ncbi:MAG: hypothetical protein NTZ35_14715, partial [Ignavibacteriales bacterium]|nr:hypothetical protein [Ignavibacteriales bacterium]